MVLVAVRTVDRHHLVLVSREERTPAGDTLALDLERWDRGLVDERPGDDRRYDPHPRDGETVPTGGSSVHRASRAVGSLTPVRSHDVGGFELLQVVVELRTVLHPQPLPELGEQKRAVHRLEQLAQDSEPRLVPEDLERSYRTG